MDTPAWGIIVDDASAKFSVWAIYDNIEMRNTNTNTAAQYGCVYLGQTSTTQYFRNCRFKNFRGLGLRGHMADGIGLENCTFDRGTSTDNASQFIRCDWCSSLAIRHCRFDGINLKDTPYIEMFGQHHGFVIDGCSFHQRTDAADRNDLQAIVVEGISRGGYIGSIELRIPGNASLGQGEHIVVAAPDGEVLIGPCGLVDSTGSGLVPRVRIRADSPKVGLQAVAFRHRIIRIPQTERDDPLFAPVAGDLIYNATTNKAEMYDGAAWQPLWQAAGRRGTV